MPGSPVASFSETSSALTSPTPIHPFIFELPQAPLAQWRAAVGEVARGSRSSPTPGDDLRRSSTSSAPSYLEAVGEVELHAVDDEPVLPPARLGPIGAPCGTASAML